MDIKRNPESDQKVYCFLGDMSALTGVFDEASRYADQFELPIVWVIEDNNKSVCTDTRKSWGLQTHPFGPWPDDKDYKKGDVFYGAGERYRYYEYTSKWPHAGFGKRVQF